LQRIDQGTARPIIAVQSVQIRTGDQKGGDPAAIVSDPDFGQVGTAAQQKCAPEDVGGFQADQKNHPL
jgi:hypothetical protein